MYRIDRSMWVTMDVFSPYGRDLDATIGYNPLEDRTIYRTLLDYHPVFHYKILQFDDNRERYVNIDYESAGSEYVTIVQGSASKGLV